MKRMHIHISVTDLAQNIRFYSSLFAAEPAVVKDDYAKWMLDDPRVNFAISTRAREAGLNHLGFQVDSAEELEEMSRRLAKADLPMATQADAACCYARSDKHWTIDPQGIAWESYRTLATIPTFTDATETAVEASACCAPTAVSIPAKISIKAKTACGSATDGTSSCC